jgi:hypothetical protein
VQCGKTLLKLLVVDWKITCINIKSVTVCVRE